LSREGAEGEGRNGTSATEVVAICGNSEILESGLPIIESSGPIN